MRGGFYEFTLGMVVASANACLYVHRDASSGGADGGATGSAITSGNLSGVGESQGSTQGIACESDEVSVEGACYPNDSCSDATGVPCPAMPMAYLKASDTVENGEFGTAMAMVVRANRTVTLAVGSPRAETAGGATYVYDYGSASGWSYSELLAPAEPVGSFAGSALDMVELDNGTIVLAVGSYYQGSLGTGVNPDNLGASESGVGAVYIFTQDASTQQWQQTDFIKAIATDRLDHFGTSVALATDGSLVHLAVGAPGEDGSSSGLDGDTSDNSAFDSGAVYVLTRDTTGQWTYDEYFKAHSAVENARFGETVAIAVKPSGQLLVAGAATPMPDAGEGETTGAVYTYERTQGQWTVGVHIAPPNESVLRFGEGLDMATASDGSVVLVASSKYDDNGVGGIDPEYSPSSVGRQSGAVWVFHHESEWNLEAYIKPLIVHRSGHFGAALSIVAVDDGAVLAVSAPAHADGEAGAGPDTDEGSVVNVGATHLFHRNLVGTWSEDLVVKPDPLDAGDRFGTPVLSSDGERVYGAFSSTNEASSAIGVDGDRTNNSAPNSGAVQTYRIR